MAISPQLKVLPPSERSALRKLLSDRLRINSERSPQNYLRLIGVLCQIDRELVFDSESLDEVASSLCDLSTVELASWLAVFKPICNELVMRFDQIIEDEDAEQLRRMNAASLWVGFRSGQVEAIVEKGLEAPSIAFEPFLAEWKSNQSDSIQLLRRRFINKPTDDASAELFVMCAIGLASLDDAEPLWECFSGSFGEAARAFAITQCHRRSFAFELLANRMQNTQSAMELASLIAAIGNYPVDKLRKGVNETLIESLKREYQNNSSSSVHGACESTLVRWKVPLPSIEISSTDPIEDLRSYRSPEGMDLVTMRVPQRDPGVDVSPVTECRVAVGAKEVTVAQFRKFCDEDIFKVGLDSFNYKVEISPTGDCPQNSVSWYLGAMFCNWLSLKEGIPEDQWCFEVEPTKEALYRLRENATYLSGYRFPSATEAKVFCGGVNPPFDQPRPDGVLVISNFPWGNDSKLLNEFAFTAENAMGKTWPAGHRLPNDLGLHDTLGSLLEWTVTIDQEASMAICTGGNYINAQPKLFHVEPDSKAGFMYRNFYFGFRVARTLVGK
ncbi:MAG: SUMF1/EgtB/PvdO family nonheme iron enzyme [Planctomycetota bacterium]|nr:SUMF1/EgtB/PvdO family nonheme iron enzyme [Planctomycetota bacterium]